jgi:hypothetical protein
MLKHKFFGLLAAGAVAVALLASPPVQAADMALDGNLRGLCGTATASANAATLANKCGVITSESITTSAGSEYLLDVTNTVAAVGDIVLASVEWGSTQRGDPMLKTAAVGAGTMQFRVLNSTSRVFQAFSGNIKIKYFLIKP